MNTNRDHLYYGLLINGLTNVINFDFLFCFWVWFCFFSRIVFISARIVLKSNCAIEIYMIIKYIRIFIGHSKSLKWNHNAYAQLPSAIDCDGDCKAIFVLCQVNWLKIVVFRFVFCIFIRNFMMSYFSREKKTIGLNKRFHNRSVHQFTMIASDIICFIRSVFTSITEQSTK